MSVQAAIQATHLSKLYKVLRRRPGFLGGLRTLFSTQYETVRAVDDVSFAIRRGEVVGYIGPNGAGKSTTIKMLTGVLLPSSGEIDVGGLRPFEDRVKNAMRIGVIFGQRSQLIWSLPARDSFALMKRLYAIPNQRYRANLESFTELLGLAELIDKPVRQLSLGQRMRCELVASMLHDPAIVYLDEPTIGLDVVAKERIREFIISANRERGVTFVLTTHDLTDIERLCRRVIILDKGRIIYDGELSEIKRRHSRLRKLVFLPVDNLDVEELTKEVRTLDSAAKISRGADGSVTIVFDPQVVPVSRVTKLIVNTFEVKDLSVEEADLEAIIRGVYESGTVGAVVGTPSEP